jgi:RNA recognition motif-containing protein
VRNRILVRNLTFSATPEALRAFFIDLGYHVQEIDLGPNKKWRLPRGYAVVTLSYDIDLSVVIEHADGKDFQGRALIVDGMRPLSWRYRSERAA